MLSIIENPDIKPTIEDLCGFVGNPLLTDFCKRMERDFASKPAAEFSKCSWEYGWNMKFKKSGKNLCTVYPREGFFTVLVVVSAKEKERVELRLPEMTEQIQRIYRETGEGNGQRWLMIDLEDEGSVYDDVFELIRLRRGR